MLHNLVTSGDKFSTLASQAQENIPHNILKQRLWNDRNYWCHYVTKLLKMPLLPKGRKNHLATDLELNGMQQKVLLSSFQFNF